MKKNSCIILFLLLFALATSQAQLRKSVLYSGDKIKSSKLYEEGNIYQKDFLLFTEMLEASHPAFSPSLKPPFSMKKARKKGYKWAKKCASKEELEIYLQSLIAQLNDGHSYVIMNLDYNQLYPFTVFQVKGKNYLGAIDKEFEQYLKEEILSINNTSMDDIYKSFKRFFAHENENHFMAQIPKKILFYSLWKNTPYHRKDKSLEIKLKNGKSILLHPVDKKTFKANMVSMKLKAITSPSKTEIARDNTKKYFHYSLFPKHHLCLLQFDVCYDKTSLSSLYKSQGMSEKEIEKQTRAFPTFSNFLDSMFTDINKKNITNLVIDVRYNGGGDSKLTDELINRLKKKSQIIEGSADIRFSKLWELNYPQLAENFQKRAKKQDIKYTLGKLYTNDEINKFYGYSLPKDQKIKTDAEKEKKIEDENYFKGKVFFLLGPKTYSSAGMLITKAVDNNIGKIIGCKSTFNPCNFGDILQWQLPNTGIKGGLSHKIFFRPNKRKYGENYITPEVEISPYTIYFDEGDKYLEWISNNTQ